METVTVNISFRKDLLESIDNAAKHESRSRSELIREAARLYISGAGRRNENDNAQYTDKADKININSNTGRISGNAASYETKNHSYSYADYLTWSEEERWEIIDGVPFDMSPAPSRRHQEILMALSGEFYSHLKGKQCKVYAAPFDVRLPEHGKSEDKDIKTVVQPDLVIVCDRNKLDNRGCISAPDLVVEILSPYTSIKDSVKKFDLYERVGVKEYWIVRPDEETVTVFMLGDDKCYGRPQIFTVKDKIKAGIFDSIVIDLQDVFCK